MTKKTIIRLCLMFPLVLSLAGIFGCGDDDNDNDSDQIVVLTEMEVVPGQEQAARDAIVAFVADTQDEEGVVSYDAYQGSGSQDHTYWFREVWRDQEAINTHFATPQFARLVQLAPTLFTVQYTDGANPSRFLVSIRNSTGEPKDLPAGAVTIAHYEAASGQDAAAQTLLSGLARTSQQEEGNVSYELFRYADVYGVPAGNYLSFAQWRGSEAYRQHQRSAPYQQFLTASSGVIAETTETEATLVTTPKSVQRAAAAAARVQTAPVPVDDLLVEYAKRLRGE